jgi:hypothetical protein
MVTASCLVCEPLPQDLVQVDQAFQVETQSTGQEWTLHSLVSVSEGQLEPPLLAVRSMLRTRDCSPRPQLLEHAFHAAKEETTQSTGQF